jgi:ABC-type transport system involved in multi-copper enzyme maturation permease subunit
MPLHKVWRESRSRFFFILAALLLVTGATVFYNAKAEKVVIESKDFHEAGERTITGILFMFWSFSALFLGFGGFVRERAVGTVDYTLSLPVSRTRWFLYRSLNGAVQCMAAAVIPALSVPAIAALSGGDFPVGDALLLGLRMGLGGMLFYAIGLLLSTIFAGDFTSAGIGIALVYAVTISTRVIKSIRGLNLQDAIFLPLQLRLDPVTHLIRRPMPWSGIAFSFALCLALSAGAWKITTKRDF